MILSFTRRANRKHVTETATLRLDHNGKSKRITLKIAPHIVETLGWSAGETFSLACNRDNGKAAVRHDPKGYQLQTRSSENAAYVLAFNAGDEAGVFLTDELRHEAINNAAVIPAGKSGKIFSFDLPDWLFKDYAPKSPEQMAMDWDAALTK